MTRTPFHGRKTDKMEAFPTTQETDEGYSEHPLYPSSAELRSRTLADRPSSPSQLVAWLAPQLSGLSVSQRKQLAMTILSDLPTTVIADIVMNHLNPRLYIDFVDYLPTEICLKIFLYLDPVSLVHVAQACRGWHDLALDWSLWEKLYYAEGWKAVAGEIMAAEKRMNADPSHADAMQPQRLRSSEFGHTHKKRAISDPTSQNRSKDAMDLDDDDADERPTEDTTMSGVSLFGGAKLEGSTSSTKSTGSVVQHMGQLMMASPSPMPDEASILSSRDVKGKGKALPEPATGQGPTIVEPRLPQSSLWILDSNRQRYILNWRYLYSMRRRLEDNWERGKFVNFQLPHPDHPSEGHRECIYSLQYNAEYLVSGSRDKTLRIWNMQTRRLVRPPLQGHSASVLCLQFDSDPEEDLIVSGSSDSDVILWRFSTGQPIQRLQKAHRESVLNVKFDRRILVTCSKDKTIKIFNRKPLRPGDQGYGDTGIVHPVAINLRRYGYDESPLSQLPIKPAYTQIGCLEGHNAAVNAVQIHGSEIVSASGDRNIKVWDWPQQICRRTFQGHSKGIACVQYDGRRIVSGSSDNEVKVFDRETGLEVASLRAHSNLVRTVQAGFGDLPYSIEEDRREAKEVDNAFFQAVSSGNLEDSMKERGRAHNAGSRRPEDITAYGASLPPGGGGGAYGRIVSGSYDQTIIIWRRDREGVWKAVHTFRQEDGAVAATARHGSGRRAQVSIPRSTSPLFSENEGAGNSSQDDTRPGNNRGDGPPSPPASAPPALEHAVPPPPQPASTTLAPVPSHELVTSQPSTTYANMIDHYVSQGPGMLRNALVSFPLVLNYQSRLQAAIDAEPDPINRGRLRAVVNQAMQRAQSALHRPQELQQQDLASSGPTSEPLSVAPGASGASRTPRPVSSRISAIREARSRLRAASAQNGSTLSAQDSAIGPSMLSSGPPAMPHAIASAAEPSPPSAAASASSVVANPSVVSSSTAVSSTPQPMDVTSTPTPAGPSQVHSHTHMTTTAFVNQIPPSVASISGANAAAAPVPAQHHHPHIANPDANPARVFKLQFDARRIICCSQTSTIVGWDFCNGDSELEEVSRFFGTIE